MGFDNAGTSEKISVLVVGPGVNVRGGISALIAKIKDKFPNYIDCRTIATCSGALWSTENKTERSSPVVQAAVYFIGLIKVLAAVAERRNKVFHIHVSAKGSILRKGLVCILLRVSGSRYLIHMHTSKDELFDAWVPKIVRHAILWGIRGCRYCLVFTQFWADTYAARLSIGHEKLVILPNPAEVPPQVPDRSGPHKLRILFLGRLCKGKGTFDLIHAFAALPEEIRQNCQFTLAGDGDTDAARELSTTTGCASQVVVTGWLERSAITRLLMESDVFALPSYAEGMSMSLLEAMGWGLAVIATDLGGATAFLRDRRNCLLVKPGDIPAISSAIQTLYEQSSMRSKLASAARQTAETMSVDKYVEKLSLLYRDVAGIAAERPGNSEAKMTSQTSA